MADCKPESMPRGVKLALVVTWLQAVLNAVGGVFLIIAGNEDFSNGRDEGGLLMAAGAVSMVIAVALGVSSFFAVGGFSWSRIVILVIESIAALGALIQMFTVRNPFAILGFAMAVTVIGQFVSRPARQWFDS